jgi:hypothetical protein
MKLKIINGYSWVLKIKKYKKLGWGKERSRNIRKEGRRYKK